MKNNRIKDISINIPIPINIIENSKKFINKNRFKKINKNIRVFCTGKNSGYAGGHNYGLSKAKTRYVLICNPDVIFNKNYFKNIKIYLKNNIDFHVIGSQYIKRNMNRPAYGLFKSNMINPDLPTNYQGLQKVDWVVGCTMLIDMKKFSKTKIFDENFFLFYEENDLCKRIKTNGGYIYSSKKLIINHFGEKGSFATNPKLKLDYIKLRNWHLMWSTFYFYKKHFGTIKAYIKILPKSISAFLKFIFFSLINNKKKRDIYYARFNGSLNSIIGKKSWFRPKITK